jgi:hypothetical protein
MEAVTENLNEEEEEEVQAVDELFNKERSSVSQSWSG